MIAVQRPDGFVLEVRKDIWDSMKNKPQHRGWRVVNGEEKENAPEPPPAIERKPGKRILHVYPGLFGMGGLERFVFDLAIDQAKSADVHILVLGTSGFWDERLAQAGVSIHSRQKLGDLEWHPPDEYALAWAKRIITDLRPTIVHHHLPGGKWLMSECEKYPLVCTRHNFCNDYSKVHPATVPICGPDAVKHGVDLGVFGGRINVGIVGRLSAERVPGSFSKMLQTFDCDLVDWWIIGRGSGTDAPIIEKALAQAKNVHLVGDVPPENMPLLYRGLDILLIPSTMDACPYAALEGMASGCATVARAIQGLPDVVGEGGVLCKDDAELLATVEELATNRPRLAELKKKARAWAETNFDIKRMRETYLRIYNERSGGAFAALVKPKISANRKRVVHLFPRAIDGGKDEKQLLAACEKSCDRFEHHVFAPRIMNWKIDRDIAQPHQIARGLPSLLAGVIASLKPDAILSHGDGYAVAGARAVENFEIEKATEGANG